MTIIEIQIRPDGGHGLQSQSGRESCWLEGWIAVPEELEQAVWACKGYCTLDIREGVLAGITPGEVPEPEPPEEPDPDQDQELAALRADVDALTAAVERGLGL